jgi:excisionase family DNA binding protein
MSQASTGLSRHERSGSAGRSPYLSTAEAAAYLNYSESHFRALVRAGKVPKPIRPNGKCLWHQPLLDDFMHALAVSQGVIPPNAAA